VLAFMMSHNALPFVLSIAAYLIRIGLSPRNSSKQRWHGSRKSIRIANAKLISQHLLPITVQGALRLQCAFFIFGHYPMKILRGVIVLFVLICVSRVNAQRPSFAIGGAYGGAFGINESIEHPIGSNFRFSLLYLRGLSPTLSLELGGGHAKLSSGEAETFSRYETSIIPLDIRLRYSPLKKTQWSPYLFGGLGIVLFEVTTVPGNKHPQADTAGGNLFATGGVGLFHAFATNWAIDISLGASSTFEDDLNPAHDDQSDGWWFGFIGVHYLFNTAPQDSDDDGLSDADETQKYKTDIHNVDSDADGLTDGAEILEHHTDPLNRDTDSDGLTDGQEIQVKANPLKIDTDGDTISDGEEFNKYTSSPVKKDTDADGLSDFDEITKYHTKPSVGDTDGDSLSDGSEILTHGTNPLSRDTDKGSVPDGVEIGRRSNPSDPADDK
jgi:hypothetical protein